MLGMEGGRVNSLRKDLVFGNMGVEGWGQTYNSLCRENDRMVAVKGEGRCLKVLVIPVITLEICFVLFFWQRGRFLSSFLETVSLRWRWDNGHAVLELK